MALRILKKIVRATVNLLKAVAFAPIVLLRAFNYNTLNKLSTLVMKILVIEVLLIAIQLSHLYFGSAGQIQYNSDVKITRRTDAGVGFISPIIRLLDEKGRFTCSGAVISDEYAVTAAHCVVTDSGSMRKKSKVGNLETSHIIDAETVGLNHRLDYAVIKGNFVEFKKLVINENTSVLVSDLAQPAKYKSCGYPQGIRELFCSPFILKKPINFQVAGVAALYPGMSGGPVINETTGEIVGINSAVSEDMSLIAPVIGILSNFGIR